MTSEEPSQRAFRTAAPATGAAFGAGHDGAFPVTNGFECEEALGAGGHAAAAAGAAGPVDARENFVVTHYRESSSCTQVQRLILGPA